MKSSVYLAIISIIFMILSNMILLKKGGERNALFAIIDTTFSAVFAAAAIFAAFAAAATFAAFVIFAAALVAIFASFVVSSADDYRKYKDFSKVYYTLMTVYFMLLFI